MSCVTINGENKVDNDSVVAIVYALLPKMSSTENVSKQIVGCDSDVIT